jgi:hypothetical protein
MKSWRNLGPWLMAVGRHWYGWVGGAAVAVSLLVLQNIVGWQPTRWHFVSILGFGLVWSVFTAWSDEHEAKLALDKRIFEFRNNLRDRPLVAPHEYAKHADQSGLIITNSGSAAFDVHVPSVSIGRSGYILRFPGSVTQLLIESLGATTQSWFPQLLQPLVAMMDL